MASQAIGVDVGSHAVKVAVLQSKGATSRALRLFRAPLSGDTDPARMQGALQRSHIAGGPALLGISGRDLIIRYTHVPPVQDWRLRLLMQFEINEVGGQSGDEVAADYRRLQLPVDSDEQTVLVALARNSWLQPRLDAARAAGMKVTGGCPCSVALFNAFLQHGGFQEEETTFLVNLGRENIDMAIQRDGELLFARNMNGGGQMFTEAIMATFGLREPKSEKNKITKGDLTPRRQARYPDATAEKLANAMQGPAGQLVSMIQSSVMICRAQTKISDLKIDRLVLSGGTASMKGIRQYFAANMSVPVELFDPAAELDCSGLDPRDAEELGASHDFAVAVGLAESLLQATSYRLEVLTEKEKKKRQFAQRTVWALAAAVAALVLVVLLFRSRASDIAEVQKKNEQLAVIQGQHQKTLVAQQAALKQERDARLKEVALRCRRVPQQFIRAVLGALFSNHAEHIYLRRLELRTKKVSLDLTANPTRGRAGDDDGSGAEPGAVQVLHAQQIWPECEVTGVVQTEFTANPGTTLNTYTTQLRGVVGKIVVEGFRLEMKDTGLGSNKEFKITFRLLPKSEAES